MNTYTHIEIHILKLSSLFSKMNKDPNKKKLVIQTMKKKNIIYHVLRCSNYLNMMITDFKQYIDVKPLTFDDKISFESVIAKQVYQQLSDTEMTLKKK